MPSSQLGLCCRECSFATAPAAADRAAPRVEPESHISGSRLVSPHRPHTGRTCTKLRADTSSWGLAAWLLHLPPLIGPMQHHLCHCSIHKHDQAHAWMLNAASPLHLPQLIGPMQHYLWILKTTHSGADMDVALEMAKGSLDGDLQWNLHDLLSHREDWWVPGKLVELRQRLQGYREVRPDPLMFSYVQFAV